MFYLLWLMRIAFQKSRGKEFEAAMMQAAYGRLMAATQEQGLSSISVPFAQAMRQWFDLFDSELDATFALKPVKEGEFPAAEWKAGMLFLIKDASSPFYFDHKGHIADINRVVEETCSRMNGSDVLIANALAKAKNSALPFILLAPNMKQPAPKNNS
jgi:hypothetical protein